MRSFGISMSKLGQVYLEINVVHVQNQNIQYAPLNTVILTGTHILYFSSFDFGQDKI